MTLRRRWASLGLLALVACGPGPGPWDRANHRVYHDHPFQVPDAAQSLSEAQRNYYNAKTHGFADWEQAYQARKTTPERAPSQRDRP